MKAIANTTISLGLVNLPVAVCKGTESGTDVAFKQVGPNGEILRQVYLDPQNNEVPRDQMKKGVQQGDTIAVIDPDSIAAITANTKIDRLDVIEVIEQADADAHADRITGKYFIQSGKNGNINAFKLFVDALEQQGKALVTKWTPRSRQELLVLSVKNGIMIANSYTFANECREPDTAVRAHLAGTYSDKEMKMATTLLKQLAKGKKTALVTEQDDAIPARQKLVADALAGKTITVEAKPEAKATSDLEDALAASLAAMGE